MGKKKLTTVRLFCARMSRSGGELCDLSLLRCLLCTQHLDKKHVAFHECGHTFCSSCLLTHTQNLLRCDGILPVSRGFELQNYGSVQCPVCWGEGVSGDRLGQVPYSHQIHELLYGIKITHDKAAAKARDKKCDLCRTQHNGAVGVARKQCYQCQAALCERCYEAHEHQFGMEHIVVRINTAQRRLTCRSHKDDVVYYCAQCNKLACEKCVLDRRSHLDHEVVRLNKIQEKQLQTVNGTRQQINQIISHKYQQKTDVIRSHLNQQKVCERVKQDIRRQADRLKANIEEECSRLLSNLDKFSAEVDTLYDNHTTYLDYSIHHLHRLQFFVQEMSTQPGMAPAVLLHRAELDKHLRGLNNDQQICEKEQLAKENLNKIPKLDLKVTANNHVIKIGELSYNASPSDSSVPAPVPPVQVTPLPKAQHYFNTAELNGAQTGPNPPGGLFFTADSKRLLVTEYNRGQIAAYNLDDKRRLERAITDTGNNFFPHKMASDGKILFVTDDREKMVKGFDRDGNRSICSQNLFNSPSGIALCKKQDYIVVSDVIEHEIRVMKKDLSKVVYSFSQLKAKDAKLKGTDVKLKGADVKLKGADAKLKGADVKLKSPEFLIVNDNDEIIISDRENHRIVTCTLDGKLVSSFGSCGAGPGQLNSPMGLCTDEYGHILVADSGNHRVCRFTSSGEYIDNVLDFCHGQTVPYGLAISGAGDIAISDKSSYCIQVFHVYDYSHR